MYFRASQQRYFAQIPVIYKGWCGHDCYCILPICLLYIKGGVVMIATDVSFIVLETFVRSAKYTRQAASL
jgi:hypothetical protein